MTFTVSLERKPAPIIAAVSKSVDPEMMVGFLPDSPVGPCVAVGCGAPIPSLGALSLIAHLHPDDAEALAIKLHAAAQELRGAVARGAPLTLVPCFDLEPGRGTALFGQDGAQVGEVTKPGDAEAMPLPQKPALDDSIRPVGMTPEGFGIANPEFSGIKCQVQRPHEAGKSPSRELGSLGIAVVEFAPGERFAMVDVGHSDGGHQAAILSREQYLAFGEHFMEAGTKLTGDVDELAKAIGSIPLVPTTDGMERAPAGDPIIPFGCHDVQMEEGLIHFHDAPHMTAAKVCVGPGCPEMVGLQLYDSQGGQNGKGFGFLAQFDAATARTLCGAILRLASDIDGGRGLQ